MRVASAMLAGCLLIACSTSGGEQLPDELVVLYDYDSSMRWQLVRYPEADVFVAFEKYEMEDGVCRAFAGPGVRITATDDVAAKLEAAGTRARSGVANAMEAFRYNCDVAVPSVCFKAKGERCFDRTSAEQRDLVALIVEFATRGEPEHPEDRALLDSGDWPRPTP